MGNWACSNFASLTKQSLKLLHMNAVIGTYQNIDKGMNALKELIYAGYPIQQISLAGRVTSEIKHGYKGKEGDTILVNGTLAGNAIAHSLEYLNGAAIFEIPEFGYLFATGAVVASIAKYTLNHRSASMAQVIHQLGIDEEVAYAYNAQLEEGKFMLITHGSHSDITKATEILEKHITYAEAEGDKVLGFDLSNWINFNDHSFPLTGA